MSDWTKEPWRVTVSPGIVNVTIRGNNLIARVWAKDAHRIVACVNAMAGIKDPSVVKELVEFVRKIAEDKNSYGYWILAERLLEKLDE